MESSKVSDVCRSKSFKETFIFGSWKCRNTSNQIKKTGFVEPVQSNGKVEDKKVPSIMPSTTPVVDTPQPSQNDTNHSPFYDCESQQETFQNDTDTNYDQLSQFFWCPRCGGRMQEPRLLPCLHSVCIACVKEFMSEENPVLSSKDGNEYNSSQNNQNIELCPVCDYPLPKPGTKIPPPHYSLQHRLVLYALQRRLSHRTVCCDTCPDDVQATLHCSKCLCNFCSDCGVEHEEEQTRLSSDITNHKVKPIWEARKVRRIAVCLDHPTHPLRFHCIACQQVTCRECMWRGSHRGHASEDAAGAGKRAVVQLTETLRSAKILLSSLLTKYNEKVFFNNTLSRSHTVHGTKRDRCTNENSGQITHFRSYSAISSHSKQARERIQEFSRLKRARYLIDAIALCEDLLTNGSDVEILNLSRIIIKRLKTLGVIIENSKSTPVSKNIFKKYFPKPMHIGIFHCCTFCSSGGKKEVTCSCNGTMPGGYKGCGHGHPGHPGVPHWSCCGSISREGYCLTARKCTYQMVL